MVARGLSGGDDLAFCDGHNAAFAFFGGVPRSILLRTKLAVARILGDGKRQRRASSRSFSPTICSRTGSASRKGNDKGKVEGLVGFIRRNFLARPACRELRGQRCSHEQCRRRQAARLRGHKGIGERLERDRQVLLPLPPAPYDACDKRPGRASSLSLVRYRSNDYSARGLRPP